MAMAAAPAEMSCDIENYIIIEYYFKNRIPYVQEAFIKTNHLSPIYFKTFLDCAYLDCLGKWLRSVP